ncbi:YidC/Oxa1 family membrane protein insertase [Thermocatellispora tengchongensis]|uniref:Membrane protein insertase YidC n=1 Tax=Thermocatellispora tengchongensis TaxID=1073253 RepID=A0A840P0G2_9ACTN|nr:membrane protein insertase YidC [Thermocatellispora tengchongensis]MBB5130757.1 YidC/Oxa1 family membrane protein insertase [Thermocatellispora tengchongensis]
MFDSIISFASGLLAATADLISPLAGANSAAVAIILFTLAVRVLLLPLALMAARGAKAKMRLAPELAKLRKRYARNPERLQRESLALYAREGASPLSGCLPSVAQLPFFALLYQVTTAPSTHVLFGAPLGQPLAGAVAAFGPLSVPVLVFVVLLALLTVVAYLSSRRAKLDATALAVPAIPGGGEPQIAAGVADSMRRIMPLLPFGSVLAAAVMPLGAGLYLLASTAWTVGERALLYPKPVAAVQ